MSRRANPGLALVLIGLTLAGCSSSELYEERMDPVSLDFGDAVRANKVAQTVDPWPANAANTRLTYSGKPMKSAVDRYYSGTILPPVATATNQNSNGAAQAPVAGPVAVQ